MANLPPRAPTMAAQDLTSWPDFQPDPTTAPPLTALDGSNNGFNNPSWIDDFVEFSSSKRKVHRRSISDSGAFVENNPEFDDEEQLIMSMFNNDLKETTPNGLPAGSLSGPASSSGNGSSNANKRCRKEKVEAVMKKEHEEVDSSTFKINDEENHKSTPVTGEGITAMEPLPTAGFHETFVDPKRVKRILANRQSARRSRVRKLQYISELERSLTILQTEVSMLSPRVTYFDHQRMILNSDNSALKSQIAALVQDKIFKDAHQEALKREIERLKQVYQQQQQQSTDNIMSETQNSSPP